MQNEQTEEKQTLAEKLDQAKGIISKKEVKLNPILKNKTYAWLILGISMPLHL